MEHINFVSVLPAEMRKTHDFNQADGGVKIVHTSATEAIRVEWSNIYSVHELQQRVVRTRYLVLGGPEATLEIEAAHDAAVEEDRARVGAKAYHAWNKARLEAQIGAPNAYIAAVEFERANPRP